MLKARADFLSLNFQGNQRTNAARRLWFQIKDDFPVQCDWAIQDASVNFYNWLCASNQTDLLQPMASHALAELASANTSLAQELTRLRQSPDSTEDGWLDLYSRVCEARRLQRLETLLTKSPRVIFTKHRTVRPSFFAYTEGLSDAQQERHFRPGSELCLLEMNGAYGKVRSLVSDPTGAIRDPAVSWDGRRVLFAWKKSLNEDDYHIYELDVASNQVRQVTSGLGFADYEPAYLPNGDLIFASSRCVQTVDCWWTEVSNLYTCDTEGRYLRRLGFDQVHTVYPQVLDDGRVIYTRWDYNDRGQVFAQRLFQMYADGTGQSEFYGNNSWFPTTIDQARAIPGTSQVLAILCGHHTSQAGKLAVIDPTKGRQENHGVQLVAPVRETPAERIDKYGQSGELWQYPCPLNDHECLVTYAPLGWDQPDSRRGDADFAIYWMDFDGRRELLVSDPILPCQQPVLLSARPRPPLRSNHVDYNHSSGTYYLQDIYAGSGLAGIPRGAIKKLRVVALEFRPAGIGNNYNRGAAGDALVTTPISIGNGSWDVKTVLGTTPVYEDGSAMFTVPARTPLYFQALDERGYAVQTMRSWSTLQPGEYFGCVGCHEHKNTAPPTQGYGFSLAMKAGARKLDPFYGPQRGFSFVNEIQPILDRHCVRCHRDRAPIETLTISSKPIFSERPPRATLPATSDELAFSLLGTNTLDLTAKRRWSDAYVILTQARPDRSDPARRSLAGDPNGRVVNWISAQSVPEFLPPCSAGAARSELLTLLVQGHKGVKLSTEELEKIACWIDLLVPYCGDYLEANSWNQAELKKYERFVAKRLQMEEFEQDNLRDLAGSKEPARRPNLMRRY